MPAAQSSAPCRAAPLRRRRAAVALAAAALAAGLALAGCGGGQDRNDVPASRLGGPSGAQTLPSEAKLQRRVRQAQRQGQKLRRRLRRTDRIARQASK